jgi:hypothetical protein
MGICVDTVALLVVLTGEMNRCAAAIKSGDFEWFGWGLFANGVGF